MSGTTGLAELDADFGAAYFEAPLPLSEPLPDEPMEVLLRVLPRIGPAPLSIGWVAGAIIALEFVYEADVPPDEVAAGTPAPAGAEATLFVTGALAAEGSVSVGPLK